MRIPRFTVRRIMAAIAILAVSWSICLGVGHLVIYRPNREGERLFRDGAAVWDEKQEPERAAHWRRMADDLARRNDMSRSYVLTTIGIVSMGIVCGGFGLARRARDPARTGRAGALAGAGRAVGRIVLIGSILGLAGYLTVLLLVGMTSE